MVRCFKFYCFTSNETSNDGRCESIVICSIVLPLMKLVTIDDVHALFYVIHCIVLPLLRPAMMDDALALF